MIERTEIGPRTAVVNRTFARRYFGDRSPVGQSICINPPKNKAIDPTWWQIAGVVGDVRQEGAKAARPEVFVLASDTYWSKANFVLRTQADPRQMAASIREVVRRIDANQPVGRIRALEENISETRATPWLRAQLLAGFAFVALLLAAIGVYGILAQEVSRRTQEFGVRLALGANPPDIGALALRRGFALASMGAVAGLAGAIAFSRYLASYLYGVTATDVPTFVGAAALLLGAAAIASYLPARRAARVDPLIALRHE